MDDSTMNGDGVNLTGRDIPKSKSVKALVGKKAGLNSNVKELSAHGVGLGVGHAIECGSDERSNLTSSARANAKPVIEINRRQIFTLDEARAVLPVVIRITRSYSQKVDSLIERLDALGGISDSSAQTTTVTIEAHVNSLIREWQNKVQKLGALPKGLWIADFDSGDGYYCWKFPEPDILFWHRYNDGFSKRIHVNERSKPISLQDRLRRKIFSISSIANTLTGVPIESSIGLQPTEIPE